MSARKSVLLGLALVLVSSLAVYALAAGVQVQYMTIPNLQLPNQAPGTHSGPISVVHYSILTQSAPVLPGPPGLPHPIKYSVVVIRRADALTPVIDKAFRQNPSFPSATFATYLKLPTGAQNLTSQTVLVDPKITDHHSFTDAKTYGNNVLMESITFSCLKLKTTPPPLVVGGGTIGTH
jgi:hypothetical protein